MDYRKLVVVAVLTILVLVSVTFALTGLQGLYSFLMHLGYAGAFISGFVGTSTVFISIMPPQIVVFLLSDPHIGLNPLFIGVAAGIGAGIGQYLHYYVGEAGRYVIPQKYRAKIDTWKPRVERYGALLIFLFAVTPVTPDDLIWIPLGMMKYPKKKALAVAIVGKTVMLVACAYAGYYGIHLFRGWLKS
jgi:membrane protein YqaA with SNARE-associated domain